MSRAIRVETRSRHKDDIKRAMHSVARVRKWEKKWVRIEDTSMEILKWMPLKNEEAPIKVSATLNAKESTDSTETKTMTTYQNGMPSKENCANDSSIEHINDVDTRKRLSPEDGQDSLLGIDELPPTKRVKTNDHQTPDTPLQDINDSCPSIAIQNSHIVESRPESLIRQEHQSSFSLSSSQMTTLTAPLPREVLHEAQTKPVANDTLNGQQQVGSDTHDDVEMMDADSSVTSSPAEALKSVDLRMETQEDFSSIARTVTDQIVTRVSSTGH